MQKIKNLFKNANKTPDVLLAVFVVFLASFGVLMIYCASSYSAKILYGDSFFFVKKQAVGLVLGVAGLIFFSFVDYHIFNKFKIVFLIVGFALLGAVLIPGIGRATLGARRWINLGPISFQASEVAKFCFVFL